ncbi:MAG: hypothetical protein A2018_02135 [Alphaproteobacteria bacterium GWF2_58_20]|nr:MAG: hypothetical protein A2018_02135 [Alphaproteobacteria bacterium GWF2_58_20]
MLALAACLVGIPAMAQDSGDWPDTSPGYEPYDEPVELPDDFPADPIESPDDFPTDPIELPDDFPTDPLPDEGDPGMPYPDGPIF